MKLRKVFNPPAKYLEQLNLKQLQDTIPKPDGLSAKDYYLDLQKAAKNGPLFSSKTIAFIEKIPNALSKDQMKWLANAHKKNEVFENDISDIPSILDYLNAENVTLGNKKFDEIKYESEDWHACSFENVKPGAYKTKKIILQLKDGYSWVEVPVEDLKTEGDLMQHCVGRMKKYRSDSIMILSLRDKNNNPHVTIEFNNSGISQIQGKQDKRPIEKYHPMIMELFDYLKPEVNWVTRPYLSKENVISTIRSIEELFFAKDVFSREEFLALFDTLLTEEQLVSVANNLYSVDEKLMSKILMIMYSKLGKKMLNDSILRFANRNFFNQMYHDSTLSKRDIINIAVKSKIKLNEKEVLELIYSKGVEKKISDQFLVDYINTDFSTAKKILSNSALLELISKLKFDQNEAMEIVHFLLKNKKYEYVSKIVKNLKLPEEVIHVIEESEIPSRFLIEGLKSNLLKLSSRKDVIENTLILEILSNYAEIEENKKYSDKIYKTLIDAKKYSLLMKNKHTPENILSKIPISELIKDEKFLNRVDLNSLKISDLAKSLNAIYSEEEFLKKLELIFSKISKKKMLDLLKLLIKINSNLSVVTYIIMSDFTDKEKVALLKESGFYYSNYTIFKRAVEKNLDTNYVKRILGKLRLDNPYSILEPFFRDFILEYTEELARIVKRYDAFGVNPNGFVFTKKQILLMIKSYGIGEVRKVFNIPSLTKAFVESPEKNSNILTAEEFEKYKSFVFTST